MSDIGNQLKTHIDAYLGTTPASVVFEEGTGITVGRFEDVPSMGLDTAITVGLSGHVLQQAITAGAIRQELMICVDDKYRELPWHEVLLGASKILLGRHAAFMLGEVIGPAGPLFPEAAWCRVTALLCSLPAYFDSDFSEVEFDDGTSLVFVELIPITTLEAAWIERHGWSNFFDRVNSGEVDIQNLARA